MSHLSPRPHVPNRLENERLILRDWRSNLALQLRMYQDRQKALLDEAGRCSPFARHELIATLLEAGATIRWKMHGWEIDGACHSVESAILSDLFDLNLIDAPDGIVRWKREGEALVPRSLLERVDDRDLLQLDALSQRMLHFERGRALGYLIVDLVKQYRAVRSLENCKMGGSAKWDIARSMSEACPFWTAIARLGCVWVLYRLDCSKDIRLRLAEEALATLRVVAGGALSVP